MAGASLVFQNSGAKVLLWSVRGSAWIGSSTYPTKKQPFRIACLVRSKVLLKNFADV